MTPALTQQRPQLQAQPSPASKHLLEPNSGPSVAYPIPAHAAHISHPSCGHEAGRDSAREKKCGIKRLSHMGARMGSDSFPGIEGQT